MSDQAIESAQQENRIFPPPASVSSNAWIKSREQYDQMYRESIDRPEEFWGKIAGELHWFKKWDRVLEWKLPYAKWFLGGKTNLSYNCLDAQIEKGKGDKTAILWEAEPEASAGKGGEVKRISFEQLRT
jgi:acetyl-CoA synthetase